MWYILILFIILWALSYQYLLNKDILKIKNIDNKKDHLMSYIPIYGFIYVKKLEYYKKLPDSGNYNYLISFQMIIKRIGVSALISLGITLVIIPLGLITYLQSQNNHLRMLVLYFVIILVILLNQGLTVDFAKNRGYEGTKYGLIGLIPIISFIIIHKTCPQTRSYDEGRKLIDVFKPKNVLTRLLIQGQVALMAVIVIVPVVYIFGMAFSDLRSNIPSAIWPKNPNLNSFKRLFTETKFTTWYKNTIIIAVINMVAGTVIITGAAYVFARFSFKGKKAGLLSILVLQAFPSFMGLLAMYVLFWKFGLLGKPTALTILYIGGSIPGNLWLIKGFLDQIPRDLDESAEIDGASKLKIFTKIILPLSIPILTFVAVSMFMGPWMDYMLPGYLLNHPPKGAGPEYDIQQQWTLAVGIFNFINDQNNLDYSAFAAASLIVGMPIAILYMAFQKYLIEGIMAGATKG